MLAWVDLETTGLAATEHAVLEVAAIVTDDGLREVGRFHRVIYWAQAKLLTYFWAARTEDQLEIATALKIDRAVIEMHAKSGLWAEATSSTHVLATVDDQFADFLGQLSVGPEGQKAQIAGSSIWLDRSFMAVSLPRTLRQLHYRSVDVTTLNEVARRFWPRLYQGRPGKREIHRAMPDIEDSLELCRYYAAQNWDMKNMKIKPDLQNTTDPKPYEDRSSSMKRGPVSGSSKDSASRFFALKSGRKVRLPRGGPRGELQQVKADREARLSRGEPQQVIDLRNPPEKWRYVEKHVPGCFFAWVQTVGIRTEGITLAVTGKPSRVNATDEGCYQPGYTGCRCYVFSGGAWQKRSHPVVECCARKTFGDGLHSPDCVTVTTTALGPQVEEHW